MKQAEYNKIKAKFDKLHEFDKLGKLNFKIDEFDKLRMD